MSTYHVKVLRGYLEKEPGRYVIPQRSSSKSKERVKSLLPSISKVDLHLHKHPDGQELAVVINGDNLWFCNSIEITVCESEQLKIEISAEHVARKQICYNQSFHNETFTPEQIGMDYIPVKVYSRFADPIAKEVPMSIVVSFTCQLYLYCLILICITVYFMFYEIYLYFIYFLIYFYRNQTQYHFVRVSWLSKLQVKLLSCPFSVPYLSSLLLCKMVE